MNQVLCPTCGAPVPFRSAASVMAVCDWCKSTLVRDADSVRNIGRMSEVLEDYSAIQIGTSGSLDGRGFTVVGRIQLRYDAGFWNEWYVIDDTGEGAWLSDASGQYTITRSVDAQTLPEPPAFDTLAPGTILPMLGHDGQRANFVAADIRRAQCTGGQGELPFAVGPGYAAYVADFRRGGEFLTLDYSDPDPAPAAVASVGGPGTGAPREAYAGLPARPPVAPSQPSATPTLYYGVAVTLASIQAQLLRDPDTIVDTAGRMKGKVTNLECPSCGASVPIVPGATTHLLCPACHAAVDTSGAVAEVIAAAERVEAVRTSLPLGAKGTIGGVAYTVIGLMRREEIDEEASTWTEYLLYAPQKGFTWLVETDDGWERADVLDTWPERPGREQALLGTARFDRLYDYQAVVRYAAGAFNWRVAVGDITALTDFAQGTTKLSAEATEAELTWSRSTPVSGPELQAWFGKQIAPQATKGPPSLSAPPAGGYRRIAKWLTILLLVVNIIPIVLSPGRALVISVIAIVCLYFPAWLMDLANRPKDGRG